VNLDAAGKRAIGVTYVDSRGREFEQAGRDVLLCSYVLNNVRLMLLWLGKPYDRLRTPVSWAATTPTRRPPA